MGVCETFLRDENELNIDGFKWIGHNRSNLHPNARRGSGGVGILIRHSLLQQFDLSVDRSIEDMLWVTFRSNTSDLCFNYCVCYLPPENSSRINDCDLFLTELMNKVYTYQREGDVIICGDFNARCGEESDFIEGVDNVSPREILDKHINSHGYSFIDFLVDCNMCMVNGRIGKNDYTCISPNGKSVVDYVLLPYECLGKCKDFKIHTMTDLINTYNLMGSTKFPDHSVIQFDLSYENIASTNCDRSNDMIKRSYKVDNIPITFLNDANAVHKVSETLSNIEHALSNEADLNDAYKSFLNLIHEEMNNKLKWTDKRNNESKQNTCNHKQNKSRAKPYWSDELQEKWDTVCEAEKLWLSCNGARKRHLKEMYCAHRKVFNRILRKSKRRFQLNEQNKLHDYLNDYENPREFWKAIGKIGLSNERKQNIPFEVITNDGTVSNDKADVLEKWQTDYERLFNLNAGNFDDVHLEYVKRCLDNENNSFPKLDCEPLNSPITYQEVKQAVYHARLKKSTGIDNIPAEVLRNEQCIDILFKIINYSFKLGKVPDEWQRGIINPIFKSGDASSPLNYRPITLLSIPCKIYANILNKRLVSWLDDHDILNEGQNGFRSSRSCLDHIYSLHSIIKNRKHLRKDTFACFIDFKKAFDTVQRQCLWYKLLSFGLNGRIINALQSLYNSVSCSVKVNDYMTDWFSVNQGVKQGCVLSPTLFSLYVNDLADEVSNMNIGVHVNGVNIAILLYADDIVLIAESERDLQAMLSKVNEWCSKWRLQVNESKTKIVHFRAHSRTRSVFQFKFGNANLEYEENYRYLGFWFNEHLDDAKSIREIAKSAGRALSAIYTKFIHVGGMKYEVYTKLIETVVEPVLFYGAGVWGQRYFNEIEVVLNKACRYFLGVGKFASNIATRGDMGWVSCKVKQKLETIRLWCNIKAMADSRLPKIIHRWSLDIHKSWERTMLNFIKDLNMEQYLFQDKPHKKTCIRVAKEKLTVIETNIWSNKLNSDGTVQNGNKLRTYRTFKNIFKTEGYVKISMNRDQRKVIAKFRSGTLPLAIETGRYARPKTPLNDRICKYCSMHTLEDETHFLLDCPFYDDIRYNLFNVASTMHPQFLTLSKNDKLLVLMSSDDIQIKLAVSLQLMLRRRKQIPF